MGHGPRRRDAVDAGRHHVAGGLEAGDVAAAGHFQCGVGALRPAGPKVGNRPALGGPDAPGGLGGQQRLEVDLVYHESFHQLSFYDRPADFQYRLGGEI